MSGETIMIDFFSILTIPSFLYTLLLRYTNKNDIITCSSNILYTMKL